jgi:hypothetical protein
MPRLLKKRKNNMDPNFKSTLNELLELAGLPINEQEGEEKEEEGEVDTEVELDKKETDKLSKEEETDEELIDSWDVSIDSVGTIKVEFHESEVTVTFKNKESETVDIPNNLKKDVDKISKLFNKILSYVERVS